MFDYTMLSDVILYLFILKPFLFCTLANQQRIHEVYIWFGGFNVLQFCVIGRLRILGMDVANLLMTILMK